MTAALAQLTKAAVLPGLALFLIILLLEAITILVAARRFDSGASRQQRSSGIHRLLMAGAIAAVFVGLQTPYLLATKQDTGRYF